MSDPRSTIPLSYMIRESQFAMAQGIQRWFTSLVNAPGSNPPGPMHRGIASYNPPDNPNNRPWSPEDQIFQAGSGRWLRVTFDHHGWDPDRSDWKYGPVKVTASELQVLADHSYLFDNRYGAAALDINLEEDVTYVHERSTTTDHTITADFGAKTKGTIGGAAEGGSLEAEVSAAFGIKDSSGEGTRDTSNVTRKQAIHTSVPAGKAVLATISSPTVTAARDFTIDGVWLASMKLGFWGGYEDWGYIKQIAASQGRTTRGIAIPLSDDTLTEVAFPSMDEFESMLQGYNVYFPQVGDLPDPKLIFAGIDHALDNRRIQWSGRELETVQHAADYAFAVVDDVDAALAKVRSDHIVQ